MFKNLMILYSIIVVIYSAVLGIAMWVTDKREKNNGKSFQRKPK